MSTENAPRWEAGHSLTDPVNLGIISILLFSQFFFFGHVNGMSVIEIVFWYYLFAT